MRLACCRWLAVATGAAALGGQVGWSRLAGAAVGATFAATALTLSCAMLGLAAGAALSGPAVRRRGARASLCGALLACAAAMAFMPHLLQAGGRLHGLPEARFALTAVLLALAHVPFGAVLPALAAWRGPSDGRASDGELCALSALGAVAGAVGSGGILAAHLAADSIGWIFAGLLLASGVPLFLRSGPPPALPAPLPARTPAGALATAFGLGFLGLAFEFAWMRLLGFAWEASPGCYAWAAASQVAGLAAGSWLAARLAPGRGCLAGALGLASLLSALSALASPWAVHAHSPAGRLATAMALLGIPAAAFGASFVLLLRRAAGAEPPGRTLGLLSAANAAGAAAGPLALWLASDALPWTPRILCLAAFGYAILALPRARRAWPVLAAAAAAFWLAPAGPAPGSYSPRPAGDFDATVMPFLRGGLDATVAVTRETDVGLDVLWIDRGLQGDSSALGRRIPGRLGRLPAKILGRPPRRALAIGLGTGLTLSGMVEGGAERVDVAELVGGVIDANRTILSGLNGRVLERPGVRVFHADGRTMLADAPDPYDLIVTDMIFPSVSGAGTLFSREFYALARRRLAADGLFVHWVPCLQLAPEDLSSVVAAFLESFPGGTAWIGSLTPRRIILGLAGGARSGSLPASTASWLALGPEELRRLAGDARPHRDSDAGLEHRSSRPPQDRLFGEDNLRRVMELMMGSDDPDRSRRAWLHFADGALAEHAGDLARARIHYRDAAAERPGETDAEFHLEQLRFDRQLGEAREAALRGEETAALDRLREAAAHPALARGNLLLGDVLAALGRPVAAAAQFERAAAKAPRSADARMKLALLFRGLGDLAQARATFDDACALRPDRPPLYLEFDRGVPPLPDLLRVSLRRAQTSSRTEKNEGNRGTPPSESSW